MIKLPDNLITKIDTLIQKQSGLEEGYKSLSERYHSDQKTSFLESDNEALAYIAARLPATYAAILAACATVKDQLDIQTVTDLGSGPGTALLALTTLWPDIQKADVIEYNAKLLDLNRLLNPITETNYRLDSILNSQSYPENDAVALSYVLNEMHETANVIVRAWQATRKCLIVVEPGTPAGFKNILKAREQLIQAGAFIAAPCPHHNACPLATNDWCHFSVRLERPYFHRTAKNGRLMYEDEKYTYLIATRETITRPPARIVKKPLHRSGHTRLDLCTPDGLKRPIFSKRDNNVYKAAKKANWGDAWRNGGGQTETKKSP